MSISPSLFHYYRECLIADQRNLSYTNIFSKRIGYRLFLTEKEVLLTGELPYYPLRRDYADEVAKELALYSREKQYAYCSWFLVGNSDAESVCAPLIIQNLLLKEIDGEAVASLSPDQKTFNLPALQLVGDLAEEEKSYLQANWPETFDEASTIQAARLLEKFFPAIDTADLYLYPRLDGENTLKKAVKQAKVTPGSWKVISASAMALMDIPVGNQAIEADLNSLAETTDFSASLSALFEPTQLYTSSAEDELLLTEILSEAQKKAIKNARRYPLSQITGPPGTGKSFTIANLAIDQLAQGQSTLIVAKTETAANVIHQLIEGLLPEAEVCIRAGKGFKRKLRHTFSLLLARLSGYERQLKKLDLKNSKTCFRRNQKKISKLERKLFDDLQFHQRWGDTLLKSDHSILKKIEAWYYRFIQPAKPPWQDALMLESLSKAQRKTGKQLLQALFLSRLTHHLQANRQAFRNFSTSLKVRTSGEQQMHWENTDFKIALKALPIWVVTLKELGTVLPLKKELFDLMIIEEATQCDMASSLPAFQRAKRAVIVGDPQQLRHLSFLSYQEQAHLQKKWKVSQAPNEALNYRDNSILDLGLQALESQDQLVLLDEHFRSQPEIIAFSNKHFYQDNLQIMTQLPHRANSSLMSVPVQGTLKKKVNKAEADAIINWVKQWLKKENDAESLSHSLGILSPFREQVNHLLKQIQENISVEVIQRHKIKVDTPYGFQGEERDIMLISMALDKESHPTAWRHLARTEVWNVSITRARHQQFIFHSVPEHEVPQPLISQYISSLNKEKSSSKATPVIHDKFLQEVCAWLSQFKEICCWPAYPLAGMEIDILVHDGNEYKGIDLVGYPGDYSQAFTYARYEQLGRMGIKVFPLPYPLWKYKAAFSRQQLQHFIE